MALEDEEKRFRLRELGYEVGNLEVGRLNSLTDVKGVKVGHSTLIKGSGKLIPGKGPIRTGVTVIIPHEKNVFRKKVRASSFVLNGYGKTIGLPQIQELGYLESFIALTNTLNVHSVADALIDYHLEENPDIGITNSSIGVVVGECNDGYLNDLQGRHVKKEHVFKAINSASEQFEEGAVGAGTGMKAFGYKGGIGSSSRIIKGERENYTLGVLVLTNFGKRENLTILGKKLHDKQKNSLEESKGSIMVIIGTDSPVNSRQLHRIAKRAPLGISRTGGFASWGSGDFIISFSTANLLDLENKREVYELSIIREDTYIFNSLLEATVDATEEAILNSLLKAKTMRGRDDHLVEALSIQTVKKLLDC
ncbi:MAG: DmpA family aminopeptidase [Candidatus Heimdallarchaeaceae archaeon]